MAEPKPSRAAAQRRAGSGVEGTQSFRRAISILRLLAQAGDKGMTLTAAVRGGGLNKATTHRMLSALVSEGLAAQDEQTRNYYLGFEVVALGIAASARYGIAQIARPNVARLADELGDTAYLSVRRGDEAVCVLREVGSFPIKTLTFPPGARTSLGVGSGPLALLAFETDAVRAKLVRRIVERLGKTPNKLGETELLDDIKEARLEGKRQQHVIKLLRREAADLEERLHTAHFNPEA